MQAHLMSIRPSDEPVHQSPLETFASEYKPIESNPTQQEKMIKAVLRRMDDTPLTPEEKQTVTANFERYSERLLNYVQNLAKPINYEDARVACADQISPIAADLYGANGITFTGVEGLARFHEQFPHPWDFKQAWDRYSTSTGETDAVLKKAYERVGRIIYGKQWEYGYQLTYLSQESSQLSSWKKPDIIPVVRKTPPPLSPVIPPEALKPGELQITEASIEFIANKGHTPQCDDAAEVGPNMFAIADGVGSGGSPSGEVVRFMTREAKRLFEAEQPTTEDAAKEKLKEVLTKTSREIQRQRALAQKRKDDGEKLDGSVEHINAVGVIGVISKESTGNYLNMLLVGNCRVFVIGKNGITLETTDRTHPYDFNRKNPDKEIDVKTSALAHVVTTTAANPAEADYYRVKINKGDIVVAMSDGVTGPRSDEWIRKYVTEQIAADLQKGERRQHSPQDWARVLAKSAVPEGGFEHDDIAVIVAVMG